MLLVSIYLGVLHAQPNIHVSGGQSGYDSSLRGHENNGAPGTIHISPGILTHRYQLIIAPSSELGQGLVQAKLDEYKNLLVLQLNENLPAVTSVLQDEQGKILTQLSSAGRSDITFNLSLLSPSVYTLLVQDEAKRVLWWCSIIKR